MMRSASGFTLIELLIVVAIISVLAAIAVPNYLAAQVRAKVSRMKSDLRTASVGLESYVVDHNRYPASFNLTPLSTPVSYITAGRIPDIFDQNGGRAIGYVEGKRASEADFLEDFEIVGATERERAVVASHRFYLYSNGPDTVNDAVEFAPETFNDIVGRPNADGGFYYDPTNGTVSRGDILRTAKLTN